MFSILFVATLQFGCTKKSESGSLRVVLPSTMQTAATGAAKTSAASAVVASSTVSASGGGTTWNTNINPTTGSDVNCYAVFIGGGDLSTNYCTVGASSTSATTIKFGPNIGFVPAGKEILLEAPAGARVIYAVGLRAATATACANYANMIDGTNLSEPFLIASQPVNIVSGTNPPVTVKAALDLTKKVIDCKIQGTGGARGAGSQPFGDKRDGGLNVVSTNTLTSGASALSAGGTRTGSAALSNSKTFASTRRVTGIATSGTYAGKQLTLPGFLPVDFDIGDEVVYYVAGGNTSPPYYPDDAVNGACGGGMYIGNFGMARITAVPSSTSIILDRPISGNPASIKTANLAAAPTTMDYCTVVVSRVSSFDTIDISAAASLTLAAAPFNYTSGTGGILAVRADTISVASTGTFTVSAANAGFVGGYISAGHQGDGINSAGGASTNPNYNGGAPGDQSTIGAGGGSHVGYGGNGAGSNPLFGMGGSPTNHCSSSSPCAPLLDQKTFMGGGGGFGAGAGYGGTGGGIVLVFARNITGGGTVNIDASGQAAYSGGVAGSGGGAGGTAALYVQKSTVTTLNMSSLGGAGTSSSYGGGGGGGGMLNLVRCLPNFTSSFVPLVTGGSAGTGGSGATSGTPGVQKVVDDAAICTL